MFCFMKFFQSIIGEYLIRGYFLNHFFCVDPIFFSWNPKGFRAVSALRAAQKKWSGPLDEEKIRQVIAENRRIQDTDIGEYAYSQGQGMMGIRDLLNFSYAERFREYDYYLADQLTEEDASMFYRNRITLLKEWLYGTAANMYSEQGKQYLIAQYEKISTPFYYDYTMGWSQLIEFAPVVIMISSLILGYLVSGIFSCEFSWKTDSVFYSSVNGRNQAIAAKIKTGFWLVTIVYCLAMALYTAIVLGYLGVDGWYCPIQIMFSEWCSSYNILVWQEYLLIVVGGYLGLLFLSFLSMWVSAKTRSAVLAALLPFVLIFLPSFLQSKSPLINRIIALLPDQTLQFGNVLTSLNSYTIGGKTVGAVPVLLVIYSLLVLLLIPCIQREYRKKEIQ